MSYPSPGRWLAVSLLATSALIHGCNSSKSGGGGSVDTGGLSEHPDIVSDAKIADAWSDDLANMIEGGAEIEHAVDSMAQTMNAHPRVAGAVGVPEHGMVWVLFESGLEHIYEIEDGDEEVTLPTTRSLATTENGHVDPVGTRSRFTPNVPKPAPAMQAVSAKWTMPATNKALVANALRVFHPNQDIGEPLTTMLRDRGYEVDRVEAGVELFMDPKFTTYSVIFIEAHGSPLEPLETAFDALRDSIQKATGIERAPCAGAEGGSQVLQTTTAVSEALDEEYADDLRHGRLKRRTCKVVRDGKVVGGLTTYAITANFIRQHQANDFPEGTFFALSSCRAFDKDGNSEWKDLIFEKSDYARVMGWNYRVHYANSSLAYLELFQVMTGSNLEFTGTEYGLLLLERNVPPLTAWSLDLTYEYLQAKRYTEFSYPAKNIHSSLIYEVDLTDFATQVNVGFHFCPEILDFELYSSFFGVPTLRAWSLDEGALTVGSAESNIGNRQFPSIEPGDFCLPSFPVGAFGTMTLESDGRTSPPRLLHRWAPVFKVSGGPVHNFATYNVTFQLHCRAIAPPRAGFAGTAATAIANPPSNNSFSEEFDPGASLFNWKVEGNGTSGGYYYENEGGGMKQIAADDPGYNEMRSEDGKTVEIQFAGELEYTEKVTDLQTGSTTSSIQTIYVQITIPAAQLRDDWTLAGGTYQDGDCKVTWQDAPATPPFDAETTPR
jgi:hypothetical protein